MAAVELDPIFVKALKLLQSKDGGIQLKAMLDDTLAQRKGLKVPSQSGDHSDKAAAALSKAKSDSDLKRRDGEKRPLEKITTDVAEQSDLKRSRFELTKHKDKDSNKEKDKERERMKKEKEKKEKEEVQRQKDKAEKARREKELAVKQQEPEFVSDEEEPAQQMDAGDFAREMGINCVVCRQFDVSSGNQLVECQECHSLYHQECHKPPVTGQDVRDPRFVWYCSRCTKSLKKMMAQKPIKSSKPFTPLSTSTKESTSTVTKTNKTESDSGSQAFRKIDPKAIVAPKETSSLSSSSKAMVGLAGLAANLAKPRKEHNKGDGSKAVVKNEMRSSGSKQENSSNKQSPLQAAKSEMVKKTPDVTTTTKSSGREDQKNSQKGQSKSGSSSGSKTEEKKHSESSSSQKENKKERSESSTKIPKEEKRQDSGKSHSGSSNNSPPTPVTASPGTDPSFPKIGSSGSGSSSSSSSNKQAVANLSMVTANKRIQMMKKKAQAQTKPEKKVHIK